MAGVNAEEFAVRAADRPAIVGYPARLSGARDNPQLEFAGWIAAQCQLAVRGPQGAVFRMNEFFKKLRPAVKLIGAVAREFEAGGRDVLGAPVRTAPIRELLRERHEQAIQLLTFAQRLLKARPFRGFSRAALLQFRDACHQFTIRLVARSVVRRSFGHVGQPQLG